MDLKSIISISGKPGLYKVVAQGKNSIIVESLIDKKRQPAYASDKISSLSDISVYSVEQDASLVSILKLIFDKEKGKSCISHKEDINVLKSYLLEIYPTFDQERVYDSDVKKIFQWYNLLLESGLLSFEDVVEEKSLDASSSNEKATKTNAKATDKSKTVTNKKAAPSGSTKAVKSSVSKKSTPVKTGSSRGK